MATKYITTNDWDAGSPATNDKVIVPESLNVDIDTNLDNGGDDYDLIYVHKGYTKNLGSTGTPLKAAADLVVFKGSGKFYFASDKNSGSGLKTDEIRIEAEEADSVIELDSNAADAGDIIDFIILRGTVTMKGNIVYDAASLLKVGFIANRASDVDLTIENGNTLAVAEQWGGLVKCNTIVTAYRLAGGTLVQDQTKLTALDIFGGVCRYNYRQTSSDATVIRVHGGGVLDLMATGDEKLFTNAAAQIWLYPGSEIRKDDNLHTITKLFDLRAKSA